MLCVLSLLQAMIYRDDVNQAQDGTFKSAALAKAPSLSSVRDGVQLETTKVISSITKNVFLPRISPSQLSEIVDSSAEESSTGSVEHQCSSLTSRPVNQQKPFPQALMEMLSQEDPEVITWLPSGDAFIVRNSKKFVASVLPKFFNQTKLTSFHRQLNLYSFRRIVEGPDLGAYQHDLFRRDDPELCSAMKRKKRLRKKNCPKAAVKAKNPSNTSLLSKKRKVSFNQEDNPAPSQTSSSSNNNHRSIDAGISDSLPPAISRVEPSTAIRPYTSRSVASATAVEISHATKPSLPSVTAVSKPSLPSVTGFSILVCDHKAKTVAEVANYSSIPCDIESFARGVASLLADGIHQNKRANLSKTYSATQDYANGVQPPRLKPRAETCFSSCFPTSHGGSQNYYHHRLAGSGEPMNAENTGDFGNDDELEMLRDLLG